MHNTIITDASIPQNTNIKLRKRKKADDEIF